MLIKQKRFSMHSKHRYNYKKYWHVIAVCLKFKGDSKKISKEMYKKLLKLKIYLN